MYVMYMYISIIDIKGNPTYMYMYIVCTSKISPLPEIVLENLIKSLHVHIPVFAEISLTLVQNNSYSLIVFCLIIMFPLKIIPVYLV